MKKYEKPVAEVIDFTAEEIMDAGVGTGPSGMGDGDGILPGM